MCPDLSLHSRVHLLSRGTLGSSPERHRHVQLCCTLTLSGGTPATAETTKAMVIAMKTLSFPSPPKSCCHDIEHKLHARSSACSPLLFRRPRIRRRGGKRRSKRSCIITRNSDASPILLSTASAATSLRLRCGCRFWPNTASVSGHSAPLAPGVGPATVPPVRPPAQ